MASRGLRIFGSGTFFFVPLAFVYGLLSGWEAVGFTALLRQRAGA